MKKIDCIWIGSYLPKEIVSKNNIIYYDEDVSSYVAQCGFINGLVQNDVNISLIAIVTCITKLIPKSLSGFYYAISYNALLITRTAFIDRIFKLFCYVKIGKKLLKGITNSHPILFVYAVTSGGCRTAGVLKKLFPKLTTVLIILDAPEFMSPTQESLIKRFLKKIDRQIINKYLFTFDKYIVVSPTLIDYMHIDGNKTICVEGTYNDNEIQVQKKDYKHNGDRVVLYAGTLKDEKSMKIVINAFLLANLKGVVFHIYGFAPSSFEKYLNELSTQYDNIKYLGFCHDRGKLLFEERQADLLLMLRDPNLEYTKYSFPSKLFEFLASGTPVLASKLEGIPEEYYQYLFIAEKFDAESIAGNLKKIFSMPQADLNELGSKAKNFILNNKNPYIQMKKVLDYVYEDNVKIHGNNVS